MLHHFCDKRQSAGYLRRRPAARPSLRHSARARRAAEQAFRRHAAARRDGARSRCPAALSAGGRTDEARSMPPNREQLLALFEAYRAHAILLVSHDTVCLRSLCAEIVVMEQGQNQ